MTTPIYYKGTTYPSLEAMPPELRAEYEQRAAFSAKPHPAASPAQPAAPAPTAPAWGGPRPAGGVPVPAAFDTVTSLGPASAVYERDSGSLPFPSFGPPRPNALVIYRDGFAFHTGQELHTWRWEEVAVIQSNLWAEGARLGHTEHEYTFTQTSGAKVILDNRIKAVAGPAEYIKNVVVARLLPPVAQAYAADQPVSFGPVTVHKVNGLTLNGQLYPWDSILDVKVWSGRFTVTLRTNHKHEVRAKDIPNLEVLGQLIGLSFYESALAYS
jgi:hypothetical protein